tara:strand:- start:226 stop:570 length:345 start_codon:yes stop_codon:yes gene_type:complete
MIAATTQITTLMTAMLVGVKTPIRILLSISKVDQITAWDGVGTTGAGTTGVGTQGGIVWVGTIGVGTIGVGALDGIGGFQIILASGILSTIAYGIHPIGEFMEGASMRLIEIKM